MSERLTCSVDRLIAEFDHALRTVSGVVRGNRPRPDEALAEPELDPSQRSHAAALMRVNHVGEVCAQALYQGQALTARDPATRDALKQAAGEEQDHLAWCADRIGELGGRTSLLNPLWYGGALAMGVAAGVLGDRWSLAFLAETERQVEEHLEGHLARLAPQDARTRSIVEVMHAEEGRHRDAALTLGAAELPAPAKLAMRFAAGVMTRVAHYL
jgi:ubiquinone biosynthesis monooxygenase Coq7